MISSMDQSWFIITKQEIIMEKLINAHKVDDSIALVFGPNPKKKHGKAYTRYEAYCHCTSLKEYLDTAEHKYAMADLRYDEAHGFLALIKDGVRINPPVAE